MFNSSCRVEENLQLSRLELLYKGKVNWAEILLFDVTLVPIALYISLAIIGFVISLICLTWFDGLMIMPASFLAFLITIIMFEFFKAMLMFRPFILSLKNRFKGNKTIFLGLPIGLLVLAAKVVFWAHLSYLMISIPLLTLFYCYIMIRSGHQVTKWFFGLVVLDTFIFSVGIIFSYMAYLSSQCSLKPKKSQYLYGSYNPIVAWVDNVLLKINKQ